MSSTYRVLCLSHDPAVIAWDESAYDEATAVGKLAEFRECPEGPHYGCDLVVGRYSYPLVSVTCPGCRIRGYHVRPVRHEANVLRLVLHGFMAPPETELHRLAAQATGCWNADRLRRLRGELGVELHVPSQCCRVGGYSGTEHR